MVEVGARPRQIVGGFIGKSVLLAEGEGLSVLLVDLVFIVAWWRVEDCLLVDFSRLSAK